jgi:hypothetical protein
MLEWIDSQGVGRREETGEETGTPTFLMMFLREAHPPPPLRTVDRLGKSAKTRTPTFLPGVDRL